MSQRFHANRTIMIDASFYPTYPYVTSNYWLVAIGIFMIVSKMSVYNPVQSRLARQNKDSFSTSCRLSLSEKGPETGASVERKLRSIGSKIKDLRSNLVTADSLVDRSR